VKAIGKNSTGVQGDVANMADLDRLFKQIGDEKGKLDIVFANAGAAEFAPFGHVDEAHFDRMFDGNVKGLLFTVQKALPLIPEIHQATAGVEGGITGRERLLHSLRVGWNVESEKILHVSHIVLHLACLVRDDSLLQSATAGRWWRWADKSLLNLSVRAVLT
jgi:NAD(P)-dependent dehydrogenase (short-subunit alcohol dehydrogenase family)